MFGTFPFGTPYPGQAPNIDPATLPSPIVLSELDASLLIVRPRFTNLILGARRTNLILEERNTTLIVGPRGRFHLMPHRNTTDGEG